MGRDIQPYRTFDLKPRNRRDRGGYQLSTWWEEDSKKGNFFTVGKRRGRDGHLLRILQPNANGSVWKKIGEGQYQLESVKDLALAAERREKLEEEQEQN